MKTIRFATAADAPRMLEIYRPYVLETSISFETEVPSLSEFQSKVIETLTKFPWLVCEIENEIVGYAYASSHRSRHAYGWSVESSVYVENGRHGQGIGAELYTDLLDLLQAQGAVNVLAGISLPNLASVRLHEKLGFSPIGIFKDVGFKHGKWWDVGWWQLQLHKPAHPAPLRAPETSTRS